jgi:hypothetical protein
MQLTTGLYAVIKERSEQLLKHGRSIAQDVQFNGDYQLTEAAQKLLIKKNNRCQADMEAPKGWNEDVWNKMMQKGYEERSVIAAALIVAEIDRINYNPFNTAKL